MDKTPTLHMSVTAYGCVDLAKFATISNRPLAVQPLPPIFPVGDFQDPKALPPLLQVFADEAIRKKLPSRPTDLKAYAELSQLLASSGGHPRRVESLFGGLAEYKMDPATPSDFGTRLQRWLSANWGELNRSMNQRVSFSQLPS